MNIAAKQETVIDGIKLWTPIRAKVSSLQRRSCIAPGYRAPAGICFQQFRSKCRLSAPFKDLPVYTQAGIVLISWKRSLLGFMLNIGYCRSLQDSADRVTCRNATRCQTLKKKVPLMPADRHCQSENLVLPPPSDSFTLTEYSHRNAVSDATHQSPIRKRLITSR